MEAEKQKIHNVISKTKKKSMMAKEQMKRE